MNKLKLWLIALAASAAGIVALLLRSKDGKVKELQKELLLTKHRGEWEAVKKDVQNAKDKAEQADIKARTAEINYRDAVRRLAKPSDSQKR